MTKIKAKNRKRAPAVAVQRVVSLPPERWVTPRQMKRYLDSFERS